MRHGHSTITPTVIHWHARTALNHCLDWQPHQHSVSVGDLLNLLLLMATYRASLSAIVRRFFPFCHETARQAVRSQLPSTDRLVTGLVDGLHHMLPLSRTDRRRHWLLAIDTHNVCYYGQWTPNIIGGPRKQGTKWFFGYATAILLNDRRRYTVGLMPLTPNYKFHEIVRMLLDQVAAKGLKIRGVALDAAFGGGETILLLQQRGLAYAIPLQRFSKNNSRNRLFQGRNRQIRWTQWETKGKHLKVRTRTVLCKGRRRTLVLAFGGWAGNHARNVQHLAKQQRELYRRRYGIETSYRQKNEAQAMTTSHDITYRLLLEGVGYLLRQVWLVLTSELARNRHAKPDAWIAELPLLTLLTWLSEWLAEQLGEDHSIPLETID
jgi:hypothetical protein